MKEWVELELRPIQIGKCSRGFLIPKNRLRLDSKEVYVLKIIPKGSYHETGLFHKPKIVLFGGVKDG